MPHFNPDVLKPWMVVHPYLTEFRHIPVANIVKHQVGYDPRINRIILPHYWQGDLVGWQTRRIVNDGSPKYQNTPDFPRAETLYNFDVECDQVVVVESPMTVVSKSHLIPEYGFVATFGAEVTQKQLQVLSSYPSVILWFDNDQAGWRGTEKIVDHLRRYCDVLVVDSPYVEDAADLPDDITLDLLAHAVPYWQWHRPAEVSSVTV